MDNDGCLREERSKLSVSEHCGIKRSHSFSGNLVSHRHNNAIRWFCKRGLRVPLRCVGEDVAGQVDILCTLF